MQCLRKSQNKILDSIFLSVPKYNRVVLGPFSIPPQRDKMEKKEFLQKKRTENKKADWNKREIKKEVVWIVGEKEW